MKRGTRQGSKTGKRPAVLVVGAHPDDEVLGCGGTIARLAGDGSAVHLLLIADGETSRNSESPARAERQRLAQRRQATESAADVLGVASIRSLDLPDNRLDAIELLDMVKQIESAVQRHRTAIVLTHHAGDVNIDHRIVHEAVVAACRPQPNRSVRTLLFFEVPSSTEWQTPGSAPPFLPNWFVDVSATLTKKLQALEAYRDELREFPHPRSLQGVETLARWRGASVGVQAAEAFVVGRRIE